MPISHEWGITLHLRTIFAVIYAFHKSLRRWSQRTALTTYTQRLMFWSQ
jgi:hypothetical protein